MTWLFCYFVEPRYGYIYRDPYPWFDVSMVEERCESAIFHCSETHPIHTFGGFLKNFGLRTCMIIEVSSAAEALALQMLGDEIVNQSNHTKFRSPSLQLVLQDADIEQLFDISKPLEDYRQNGVRRREENQVISTLQCHVDRLANTLQPNITILDDEYLQKAYRFIDDTKKEIERMRIDARTISREATRTRKLLNRQLMKYAIYTKG